MSLQCASEVLSSRPSSCKRKLSAAWTRHSGHCTTFMHKAECVQAPDDPWRADFPAMPSTYNDESPAHSTTCLPPIAHGRPTANGGPAYYGSSSAAALRWINQPALHAPKGSQAHKLKSSCARVLCALQRRSPRGGQSCAIQSGEIAGGRCPRRGRFVCATHARYYRWASRGMAWEDRGEMRWVASHSRH